MLVHCIEAYGGVEFRSFTHSDLRHKIGVNSLLHATSLFPPGYEALVYIDQEAGNPHSSSGCFGVEKNLLSLPARPVMY